MKKKYLIFFFFCVHLISYTSPFLFIDNKNEKGHLSTTFLQQISKAFSPDYFIESGTYDGGTARNASPFFKEVHTIELYEPMFQKTKLQLRSFTNIKTYHGSSPEVFHKILPQLKGTVIFWLDAHYSGQGTALSFDNPSNQNAVTAIRQELEAIRKHNSSDCIILIDDMRGFGTIIDETEYIGCWAYPSVQEIREMLKQINPHFSIVLLGDTLLAYDGSKHSPDFSQTALACTLTRFYDGKNLTDNQLLELEETIMKSPENESQFIRKLYDKMTYCKDPLFIHDLWYGLVCMGKEKWHEAYTALMKVPKRTQVLDCKRNPIHKEILYEHPRIRHYLKICKENQNLPI